MAGLEVCNLYGNQKNALIFLVITLGLIITCESDPTVRIRTASSNFVPSQQIQITCEARDVTFRNSVRFFKKVNSTTSGTQTQEEVGVSIDQRVQSPFSDTNRYVINRSSSGVADQNKIYSLVITDVQPEDSGLFGCRLTGARTVEVVLREEIIVFGPVSVIEFTKQRAGSLKETLRDRATLRMEILSHSDAQAVACHVEASLPMPTVQILLGDEDITMEFNGMIQQFQSQDPLGLQKVTTNLHYEAAVFTRTIDDNGKVLQCLTEVPRHGSKSVSVTLDIRYPPQMNCEQKIARSEERNVVLHCIGRSNPRLENINWWYIDEQEGRTQVLNNTHHKSEIEYSGDNFTAKLIFYVMHDKHFGKYSVDVVNSEATTTKTLQVFKENVTDIATPPPDVVTGDGVTTSKIPVDGASRLVFPLSWMLVATVFNFL